MNKHIKSYSPILESDNGSTIPADLMNRLVVDALNSIFLGSDNSVILLSFDEPRENPLDDAIEEDDDSSGRVSAEYSIELDCLYIGDPELDEELKSLNLRRFDISIELNTGASYSIWSDPGDYYTPGDSGTDLSDETTEIISILFNGEEIDDSIIPEKFTSLLSDYGYDDILHDLKKNGKKFIP